jgi:hypothetical protein
MSPRRIVMADGSNNSIADSVAHTDGNEANGAISSDEDLTICGDGVLSVEGNYNDAIAGKDGLVIKDASLTVTAVDDGIRGKDYLVVESGNLSVQAGGDGLKSDNEEDASRGYILIEDGQVEVNSGGDAITAQTDVIVMGGTLSLKSGGGSNVDPGETSAKGVKGLFGVFIEGGTFTIDAADDAIHSNNAITIDDGTFSLISGDDGVHADLSLWVDGGAIEITNCYEGLESQSITIDNGTIHLTATDDGLNAAKASTTDSSTETDNPNPFEQGRNPGGFETCDDCQVNINGGWIALNSDGDGLDSNGSFLMTGGTAIVNGPTGSANSAIDCNGDFGIFGGFLVSVHTEQMSDEINGTSTQNILQASVTLQSAGTPIHIQDDQGASILTFRPVKSWKALVFSSPDLKNGSYTLYTGGSVASTTRDGLCQECTYTPGTAVTGFTVSSILTSVGNMRPNFP